MKMMNKETKGIILIGGMITILVSAVCFALNLVCGILSAVSGIVLIAVFAAYTMKRYRKLSELNNYLSLLCAGHFDLDICDNTESELSILKNNLYKIMIMLKTQNEMLEKEKTYLADSLADISHQLKTPLTSMMVMTDIIKAEKDENKKLEFVTVIENQLEKMKWLILNLLKLSKLDADTVDFKSEKLSIAHVIRESLKPFMVTVDLKNIKIENKISDFSFNGDENWSIEAFENIIKNCIEHTQKNGKITISSTGTSLYNSVFISDNGCGIREKDLPHIFERFYHGENASSESIGIGLALSKTVFEKEKGEIFVQSEEGKGTTFEIRLYKAIV